VDWNSEAAQEARFAQLVKVINRRPFRCWITAAATARWPATCCARASRWSSILGFDVLESMVVQRPRSAPGAAAVQFTASFPRLTRSDYAIASGIFNIRLETPFDRWTEYVTGELHKMDQPEPQGFSVNFLTKYSDAEYMRPHLYYADPCYLFDYCKRNFRAMWRCCTIMKCMISPSSCARRLR
jgi:hypothetical protein